MANLPESATWEAGIYQLEETDPVQGGPNGIDNQQGKQLANRTTYLKEQVESLGTGKQPLDATLTAIAALVGIADRIIYFNGPDTVAMTPITAFIRTLLDDADASTARATLGAISQAQLDAAIAALVNSSPATLDTLNELATALGNDANFATTMTNAMALKASIQSIQKAESVVSAAGGMSDAITGSYTPGITALTNGMTLYVRAASANATASPTFTPASGTIAAKTIVKGAGSALVAGDIAGGGHWIELQYDATLDKWVLLNPATGMATVTATNNASFADNSVKPASTSWVRGAMAAIATEAGFAYSFGANGYIKFPSWLGAWIVQWGALADSSWVSSTFRSITYPITFPTNVLQHAAVISNSAGTLARLNTNQLSNSQLQLMVDYAGAATVRWIAVGN